MFESASTKMCSSQSAMSYSTQRFAPTYCTDFGSRILTRGSRAEVITFPPTSRSGRGLWAGKKEHKRTTATIFLSKSHLSTVKPVRLQESSVIEPRFEANLIARRPGFVYLLHSNIT